jgi:hypothetical protein
MTPPPILLAIGHMDGQRVLGTGGLSAAWADLDAPPPGNGRTFRALFGRPDATFRRLDSVSRALVLAAEAADLPSCLPGEARDDTAVVLETRRGVIDTDLRFLRQLEAGIVDGPIFPYTLPSASLGEVALRHGLRGPSLCLSIGPGECGTALREARHLLEDGDATHALAARVEVLSHARGGMSASLRASVVLLAPAGTSTDAGVADWPDASDDPFDDLVAASFSAEA